MLFPRNGAEAPGAVDESGLPQANETRVPDSETTTDWCPIMKAQTTRE